MKRKVLICKNVSRKINGKSILKNVNLILKEGDVLGIIGPNGAGKSTLLKIITGIDRNNEGDVFINNHSIKKDFEQAIKKVGGIIESPSFYNEMSGLDNLKIMALYYNVSRERINEVIGLLKMELYINKRVSSYSLGMKQRLGIAVAILKSPRLLILDEPTNGLDYNGVLVLRNLIHNLQREGVAVIISSHNLLELEKVCTKYCFLKNGEVISNSELNNQIKLERVYMSGESHV